MASTATILTTLQDGDEVQGLSAGQLFQFFADAVHDLPVFVLTEQGPVPLTTVARKDGRITLTVGVVQFPHTPATLPAKTDKVLP